MGLGVDVPGAPHLHPESWDRSLMGPVFHSVEADGTGVENQEPGLSSAGCPGLWSLACSAVCPQASCRASLNLSLPIRGEATPLGLMWGGGHLTYFEGLSCAQGAQ